MKNFSKKLKKSLNVITKQKPGFKPKVGLILGSGLGVIAEEFEDAVSIPYSKIPYFPTSTVKGHANTLILGEIYNLPAVIMKGRFHYYEGYPLADITYPVRVLKELGIDTIIITNAAGGANRNFKVGDLMIITDHINFMGANPLRGWADEKSYPRFIDMTFGYSPALQKLAEKVGRKTKIKLQKGVYAAMPGPSYETPAEIKMLSKIGADAVGMSTVPEAIVANQVGLNVMGISLITNLAAGILKRKLDHKEVIEASEKAKGKFIKLVKGILKELAKA